MKIKYSLMHQKLESSRHTLNEAQDRINRQNQIRATVNRLKERANVFADKLNMKKIGAMNLDYPNGIPDFEFPEGMPDFEFPQPLINMDDDDDDDDTVIQKQADKVTEAVKQRKYINPQKI
jgi:hypothetical protein